MKTNAILLWVCLPRTQASTNGVFVNDVKIQEHPLEHGDIVQFGGAADIAVGTRFDGAGSHIRCDGGDLRVRASHVVDGAVQTVVGSRVVPSTAFFFNSNNTNNCTRAFNGRFWFHC